MCDMDFSKKGIVVILFLALVGTIANAQDNNFSNTLTIGIGLSAFDSGVSYHAGYNPCLSVSQDFAIEGQLSYAYTDVKSVFLAGGEGRAHSINFLLGGRMYLPSKHEKICYYINLMAGGLFSNRDSERQIETSELVSGFSGGIFANINQFVVGLSVDAPTNLILKVGYTF